MKQEGGLHAKDHVRRVMLKMLSEELQVQVNRTGGYGKEKLHEDLIDLIKRK